MTKRYSTPRTSRITASRVRVGTCLYHGGIVTSVERMADGRMRITNRQGGWVHIEPADRRLTYYPHLSV